MIDTIYGGKLWVEFLVECDGFGTYFGGIAIEGANYNMTVEGSHFLSNFLLQTHTRGDGEYHHKNS
jgi:hypothetical protein